MEYFLHDTKFTEAFANTEHVVLGKRLAPFCLWHQFLLEQVQSKVLVGVPLNVFDLWVATRICTTPWNPSHQVPRLKPPPKFWFTLTTGRYNLTKEVKKFSDYLEDYVSYPKFWPNNHEGTNKEGSGDRDMDDNLELAAHLVTATSLTWREAWTMPIGIMRWTSIAALKLSGAKIDIWTPEHQARFEIHVKNREAKIDAAGKAIAEAENIPYEDARKRAHDEYWADVHSNYAISALKSKYGKR